ncbi:hypothetical protein CAEBREN_02571 [Caenorhabditis brenneri]|uniref:Receptor L-domain domain-containing protein n=1 Tax=Caenorhabditis brenneri TaxID=135651 RepID=G0N3S6_CAEBE|nr:hypothetical protein CAEBREN_02571 [Caenorhabditis brenneri]
MKIFVLLLLYSLVSTDFTEDLKIIKDNAECDPKCVFNYSEVTSSTIQFFPQCSDVCGILVLNENTDLTEEQLKEAFKPMQALFGGLVIENTKLTSLSFFTIDNIYGEFSLFCEDYGVFIKNNSLLTDISILRSFYIWPDDDFHECTFKIENNQNLDTSITCDNYESPNYLDVMTIGNLKDCGCRDSNYGDCEELFGGLRIINVTDNSDLSSLENIRRINGFIDIQNSTLEDLSFLKKVESIGIKNFGLSDKISINIQNNLKMTRLGLPLQNILFNFEYNRIANLENLHPDFCITVEEIINFLELNLFFVNIHAKYCDSVGNLQGSSLCRFDEMSNLKNNCEYVFGTVEIGSGDEENVKKLRKMTHLFGTLSIKNTKLKDLDFLENLRYIGNLDEHHHQKKTIR